MSIEPLWKDFYEKDYSFGNLIYEQIRPLYDKKESNVAVIYSDGLSGYIEQEKHNFAERLSLDREEMPKTYGNIKASLSTNKITLSEKDKFKINIYFLWYWTYLFTPKEFSFIQRLFLSKKKKEALKDKHSEDYVRRNFHKVSSKIRGKRFDLLFWYYPDSEHIPLVERVKAEVIEPSFIGANGRGVNYNLYGSYKGKEVNG